MISKKNIEEFEHIIKFQFSNKKNLIKALIHPSYILEKENIIPVSNEFERLEFLGDRVLGLAVSDLIYSKFKKLDEGSLSKKLSYLVQKKFLYKISKEIKIEKFLKFSYKNNNLSMNISILSDSVESLIGSIFVDSGYLQSVKFIENIWGKYLDIEASTLSDPKTNLQELSQKNLKKLPLYSLLSKDGPPHSPIFTVSLNVFKLDTIKAKGASIREAETNAAIKALKIINDK